MEGTLSMVLLIVLLALTNQLKTVQPSSRDEKLAIKRRLEALNKPSVKSFLTKYGDIVDCVDINKQLAFDHPLLKNHTIKMKPSFKILKQSLTSNHGSSVVLKPSDLLPKSMRCPRGTVPIKRVTEEDLALEKFSLLKTTIKPTNSSKSFNESNDLPPGHQIAILLASIESLGATGYINVWKPEVSPTQLSDASIFVASEDGSVSNAVTAGWMVNPFVFHNHSNTWDYAYWTKDSGKSTGCFNLLCPGFIQVSQKVYLGMVIPYTSTYDGPQYYAQTTIQQDPDSKDWWIFFGDYKVGYYPNELFSTLTNGATRAGWGGEISSPATEPTPAMGSGHFPNEGRLKAAVIYGLNLQSAKRAPRPSDNKLYASKPDCYKVEYAKDTPPDFGHYMIFGGPPNCKL